MMYLALWLWFFGAYMTWEGVRDNTDTRPDPSGYFFDPKARAFHDAHPEFHKLIYVLSLTIIVVLWPISIPVGIVRSIHIRMKLPRS